MRPGRTNGACEQDVRGVRGVRDSAAAREPRLPVGSPLGRQRRLRRSVDVHARGRPEIVSETWRPTVCALARRSTGTSTARRGSTHTPEPAGCCRRYAFIWRVAQAHVKDVLMGIERGRGD